MATTRKSRKSRPSKLACKRRAKALPKKRTASAGKSLAACRRPAKRASVRNGSTGTVKVYEVLYDGAGSGPAGDGTYIFRSKSKREADAFAKGNTTYGRPAKATLAEVPKRLAERWGL